MSNKPPLTKEEAPQRVLGVRETVTLIVGLVIGAGIFKTPSLVANFTGSPLFMFGAWILGGVLSLIGALCYAELASAYPNAGGDYHFIYRAFGEKLAFLFGWARLSVITTGSIALLAFVFGDYMNHIVSLDLIGEESGSFIYAIFIIIALTFANIFNLKTGIQTQTIFTALQVLSLLIIVAAAIFLMFNSPINLTSAAPTTHTTTPNLTGFGLAMVFVLLTFGGWNEAAYVSAEIKDGAKNIVRSLVYAICIITVLYLLVTWAYYQGLGFDGLRKSSAVAADLTRQTFGGAAEIIISAMIAISALTSINATIIVGARTSYAMGNNWSFLRFLGVWNKQRNTPVHALIIQAIASLLLVIAGKCFGSGFKAMVEFTSPVFWLFFLLAGISLFILRIKDPKRDRPFKVPFFPVLPIIFCLGCAYMLYSSLSYVYDQTLGGINAAWIGVIILLIGMVILAIISRLPQKKI